MSDRARPIRVVQFLWRLSVTGGIQRVVRDLLRGLDTSRFDIHLCSVRPLLPEDGLDEFRDTVSLHTLDIAGSPSRLRQATAAIRLAREIQRIDPDVVHAHSGTAWYLIPSLVMPPIRRPVVFDVHDSPQSSRVSAFNARVEAKMLGRRGVTPVAHSASVAQDLASATGVRASSIETIPIGIETSALSAPAAGRVWRRKHQIPEGDLIVAYVARLVPSKNVGLFLQVAAEVARDRSQVRFVVVGDGPDRAELQAAAASLGLADRLLFTGPEADLTGVLSASDVFLSTSDYEGFGIAILEAMSARTAVVATGVGGTVELVVPGVTGFLAPPGRPEGLVLGIRTLIDDSELRDRMAQAGHSRARESFDVSTMVAKYEALYERIAAKER